MEVVDMTLAKNYYRKARSCRVSCTQLHRCPEHSLQQGRLQLLKDGSHNVTSKTATYNTVTALAPHQHPTSHTISPRILVSGSLLHTRSRCPSAPGMHAGRKAGIPNTSRRRCCATLPPTAAHSTLTGRPSPGSWTCCCCRWRHQLLP